MQDFFSKLDRVLLSSATAQQPSSSVSPAPDAPSADVVHVKFSAGDRGYITVQLRVGPAEEHSHASNSSKAEPKGLKPEAAQGKFGIISLPFISISGRHVCCKEACVHPHVTTHVAQRIAVLMLVCHGHSCMPTVVFYKAPMPVAQYLAAVSCHACTCCPVAVITRSIACRAAGDSARFSGDSQDTAGRCCPRHHSEAHVTCAAVWPCAKHQP